MISIQNPYTPMLLTFSPENFHGRETEIINIIRVITARNPDSYAIYGLRTVGKTTLLKYLMAPDGALHDYEDYVAPDYRPGGKSRLLFVYISFHQYQVGYGVIRTLAENLRDVLRQHDHPAQYNIGDEPAPREKMIEMLRMALDDLRDDHVRVVFLMDDFDAALAVVDDEDDRLLRVLSDLSVLIITTESPISQLRPDLGRTSPLLGILRPEALSTMNDQSARELLTTPLAEVNATLTEKELNFLINVAGRMPYLLLSAGELYFNMRQEYPEMTEIIADKHATETLREQFVQRLLGWPHIDDVMNRLWRYLKPEEQKALLRLINARRPEELVGLEVTLSRLATMGLTVLDIKQGGYRPFGLILVRFLQQLPDEKPISSAEHPILNNLSPLDSRLLTYFLKHPNTVCRFETLQTEVWDDGSGSKRALEAAVHRIRQLLPKGEAIRNVRGKGYTYVQKNP